MVSGLVIWGMKGLLKGMTFNTWFSYFVNIGLVSKYIGYKWWKQLLDLTPVTLASVVVALLSFGCGYLLNLTMYPDGIVKSFVYFVLYLGWSIIIRPRLISF